ncbi:Mitochondrial import inner membrane translocase subunit Tim54 [Penicillium verhagenii]|uniref:Mitochondrial import inner membrane translocase subunit Tim54 n=1 Tax=Penicillium verhagenii TaxID=1562060 RepID=UPI00254551BC|nr:Mitochondrial import inner membrane translocase subunit Tim54 [Penicillium verhagenii]KAJ5935448.1 Mitochondrial import inner membrane translocase subunit Tim54 [Penicillium verhagenii]
MADSSNSAAPAGAAKPQAAPKPPNPVFKMMGLPNIRLKLPSRNWMIFLTITGSFASAIIYDRREKRRSQQKWSELVAHIAKEPLGETEMRRRLTVYLAAPPGDGLKVARDHFKEYVKPILTAAALDYTVVEGRREGQVRASTAENIRKLRRRAGEPSTDVREPTTEDIVVAGREAKGIRDESGPKGDLVIGRHTWKEYIRGLHEGWLGPMDAPVPPPAEIPAVEVSENPIQDIAAGDAPIENTSQVETLETLEKKLDEDKKEEKDEKKEEEKPSKPTGPPDAYITSANYPSAQLPPSIPQSFDSSTPIEFPHILGFLNTPIRMYRYLNQRHLAEDIGREVAAVVLANSSRPFRDESFSADSELSGVAVDSFASPEGSATDVVRGHYEQQTVLEKEEKEWHKSVHKRDEKDLEREWLDDIVLDPRIASRMSIAQVSPEDEARSQRLATREEYILGEERPLPVSFWKSMWIKYGYGEDEETIRRKPIYGNYDGEFDA